ncbi:MerR family transcriptional regulator [Streptomyces sp. NPDC001796]|uniref:MerR family transcriptional regulator n=1 Tax=Streptomyces sp. NPDC001796 TaxID=3364609 RepID=UPI0036BC26F8
MRISELSRRSGVSIPTIKYYLREGMLPRGQLATVTRADYGEEHLHRLRLIRTLIGVRQLSVGAVKEILGAIAEERDLHQIIGILIDARPASLDENHEQEERVAQKEKGPGVADARRLISEMGWEVDPDTAAVESLGDVLDALSVLGADIGWQTLLPYARLADRISELDMEQINGTSGLMELAERAVLVCVLLEPALLALRRLAAEDKSACLFSGSAGSREESGAETARTPSASASPPTPA